MLKIACGWWKLPRPADLMAALRRTAVETQPSSTCGMTARTARYASAARSSTNAVSSARSLEDRGRRLGPGQLGRGSCALPRKGFVQKRRRTHFVIAERVARRSRHSISGGACGLGCKMRLSSGADQSPSTGTLIRRQNRRLFFKWGPLSGSDEQMFGAE